VLFRELLDERIVLMILLFVELILLLLLIILGGQAGLPAGLDTSPELACHRVVDQIGVKVLEKGVLRQVVALGLDPILEANRLPFQQVAELRTLFRRLRLQLRHCH